MLDEISKTQQAIKALEAQRSILGDEVVEISLAALLNKLQELQSEPAPEVQQQRKLATILFTDIAGHTTLTRNLDPEENMTIIDSALVKLAAVIDQHGGHIARYQGDGFKAVFGLPIAHESDPENAVLAGLALLNAAREYNTEMEAEWGLSGFNVRVGIDTGLIFAGGVTEAEDTIKGMVVNLAARLESAADPGSLLISHHTYQHVRGLFDIEALAPIQAKGFSEPVPVYRVLRAKPRAFRMARRGLENIETRTIGREKELQALQDAYHTAVEQKKNTVVTLVGEAGVGKSRLIYEFNNWLDLQPGSVWFFRGRASQQTQGVPQYLLRDMLADHFEILDSDPLEVVQMKFSDGIASFITEEAEMKAHILGTWLGYDFRNSPHLLSIKDDPEQIKKQATLYLAQIFSAITEQNPSVVILDDIHWADSGSLETIVDLARRRSALPLLVACLTRSSLFERKPEWGDGIPNHTRLYLESLSSDASRSLVEEILRLVESLPPILVDLVSSRAEGNPFYAEELVKMLIDDGVIQTGPEHWTVKQEKLAGLNVPPTLTEVLQARLDKLQPSEKQSIQEASVIGRTFWDGALAALDAEGPEAIPALQTKEFIFPRHESTFEGTSEYIFKHAILRDVTYETVLKRMRGKYHTLAGDWLATMAEANGRGDEFAALIGEHYQLAGKKEQAAIWYRRAGEQAARIYAHEDAVRYLKLALEYTPSEQQQQHLDLLFRLAQVYESINNAGSDTAMAFTQTLALARKLGDTRKIIQVLGALTNLTRNRSELDLAQAYGEECLRLAEESQDPELLLIANLAMFWLALGIGHYLDAVSYIKPTLDFYRYHRRNMSLADAFNYCFNLGLGGIVLVISGFPDLALKYGQEALELMQKYQHHFGTANALGLLSTIHERRGEYQDALRLGEAMRDISHTHNFHVMRTYGEMHKGACLALLGNPDDGIVFVRNAIAERESMNMHFAQFDYLAQTGLGYGLIGQVDKGLALVNEAIEKLEDSNDRQSESLILRIKADLLLMQDLPKDRYTIAQQEAETYFHRAIEIAKHQQAKLWEARALASLCRLLHSQGRDEGIRQQLADLYEWFTEGFETEDLRFVRSVLESAS